MAIKPLRACFLRSWENLTLKQYKNVAGEERYADLTRWTSTKSL